MDILEELPPVLVESSDRNNDLQRPETDEQVSSDLSEDELALMQALGHDPASVDALVERTGWSVERVSGLLVDLELRSCINALPGGIYMRTYPA
jgi:DNA processing protein